MKAVILVAGCSRRLRPLTNDTPKCLLAVAGKPILQRMLEALLEAGIDSFVMVTGYLGHKIRAAVASWYPDLDVAFPDNPDYATTNNGVSLLLARDLLEGHDFLVLDGDVVGDKGLIHALVASPHGNCVALRPADDLTDEEVKLELDGTGRILRIGKPNVPLDVAIGESMGVERISAQLSGPLFAGLQRMIDAGGVNEYREVTYQHIIDDGAVMFAVDVGGYFCTEIDTPEDLELASQQMLERGL